jgi:hypothetical protein
MVQRMAWPTHKDVKRWFPLFRVLKDDQVGKVEALRDRFAGLADLVLELGGGSADTSAALRALRLALFWAEESVRLSGPAGSDPDRPALTPDAVELLEGRIGCREFLAREAKRAAKGGGAAP